MKKVARQLNILALSWIIALPLFTSCGGKPYKLGIYDDDDSLPPFADGTIEPTTITNFDFDAWVSAVQNGNKIVVEQFLNHEDGRQFINTPIDHLRRCALHLAAQQGNRDIVDLLINHQANLNSRDRNGGSPLHWAAAEGRVEVARRILGGLADWQLKKIRESKDRSGETPLHRAARSNKKDMAALLVSEFGANVNSGAKRTNGGPRRGMYRPTPLDVCRNNATENFLKSAGGRPGTNSFFDDPYLNAGAKCITLSAIYAGRACLCLCDFTFELMEGSRRGGGRRR